MKTHYFTAFLFCLFINFSVLAQPQTPDKIVSFSDKRVPDKLIKTIKAYTMNTTNENFQSLKGSASEDDSIFYNTGTIKYKWELQFDSATGNFTGKLNQIAYIKENNSKQSIKTIKNDYTIEIKEELYCCVEHPDTCCLWPDRKKYPGCTWEMRNAR
jgi:CO dehydrogenase/acetyl-CoA synthase epsilon subunit